MTRKELKERGLLFDKKEIFKSLKNSIEDREVLSYWYDAESGNPTEHVLFQLKTKNSKNRFVELKLTATQLVKLSKLLNEFVEIYNNRMDETV